ncbi:MAG: DHH family phosphoesterase, partial [Methanosarcinales archaeon]
MKPILKKAHKCAEVIKKQKEVLIVSHIDADGLTSAGIICKALDRINIDYTPIFLKQLDNYALEKIADINPELVIFTDLGSGYLDEITNKNLNAVVVDHHQPVTKPKEIKYHLNPMNFGYNGSLEISGSGTTFLLSLELGENRSDSDCVNRDLADLAIVGAVGDLQAIKEGKLIGLNREILEIGVSEHVLEYKKDLSLFGKQTRPVFKLLQYSTDPYLPGLTGDEDASIEFLRRAGIELKGERWKRW